MKRVVVGLAALALAVAVPRPANALVPNSITQSGCAGTGSFEVCASITASVWGDATSGYFVGLAVTNLYGTAGGGVSQAILAAGIGSPNQTFPSWSLSAPPTWTTTGLNSNPIADQWDLFAKQTGNDKILGGQTLYLVFDTGMTELDLTDPDLVMGWHAGAVNGSTCSMWANTNGDYTPQAQDLETCTSTVPEPVTMILLGTGLAGIGALRRRRKGFDVENA